MPKNVKQLLASALAVVFITVPGAASAAADIFLKLANIPGDSTTDLHKGEIEIISFSLGFVNSSTAGSARTAAKCGDVTLTKNIDRASPGLLAAVMTGRHIATGVLSFTLPGAEGARDYYVLTMEEVLVTSVQQSDVTGGEKVLEHVTLNARTFKFHYSLQNPDGTSANFTFGWDCVRNSPA